MKKLRGMAVIFVSLILFCTACTGDGSRETLQPTAPEAKAYQGKLDALRPKAYGNVHNLTTEPGAYISIIGRNDGDSYWNEVKAGAKQAVDDLNELLGYTGADKIKLNYSAPKNRDDVDEQINILDEELARYPIAVGIAAVDATACQVQFDLAMENSIPIVMIDSGSEYKDVAATCSTNNAKAARTAALQLADAIECEGEIAVFVQDSISMTAKQREQAFLEKIEKDYPNIRAVSVYRFDELAKIAEEIAKEQNVNADKVTQADVIKRVLDKNPNLKGIYTTNLDVTQEVVNVIAELERTDLKIVGFDGGEEQMALVNEGKVEGLIVQNPFGMGYATVVAIVRASQNMGNEAFVNSGYTWITKDNMNVAEIQKMIY